MDEDEPSGAQDSPASRGEAQVQGFKAADLIRQAMDSRPGTSKPWTPPTVDAVAALLPQYRIKKLLGHGGMGAVYEGEQGRLERPVAIKLLAAHLAADPPFVFRFEREARLLAKLKHSGIVAVYDSGQTAEGHLYFVMEFVDGVTLAHLIAAKLEPAQALDLVSQICEALQYAHAQGLVHRDIKPANVLVTKEGKAKLADFGLARPLAQQDTRLTHGHVVMGTPDYMAPEQHRGTADHRADIYALGAIFYEMLTGEPPHGVFQPPSARVQVDVKLDHVVVKALQHQPELRYQQASEMQSDVDDIRRASSAPPAGEPAPARSMFGRRLLVAAVGMVAAALLGYGLSALQKSGRMAQPPVEAPTASAFPKMPGYNRLPISHDPSYVWSDPVSSQPGPNRILDARLSPPPPARLKLGQRVNLTFRYATDQAEAPRISATPLVSMAQGPRPPAGISSGGTPLMPELDDTSRGSMNYFFSVGNPEHTDQVGITMRQSPAGSVLASLSIPADYQFEDAPGPGNPLANDSSSVVLDESYVPNPGNGWVCALCPLPEGGLAVGGAYSSIAGHGQQKMAKLHRDGSLDSVFCSNLAPALAVIITSLVRQPDGKIILGGLFSQVGGWPCSNLARLNQDGTVDRSFAAKATAERVDVLQVQPDGKILVGGEFSAIDGEERNGLGRLNPDGTLDRSFAPPIKGFVQALRVQPDGRILVGGSYDCLANHSRRMLARLNSDGSLDESFDARMTPAKSDANHHTNSLGVKCILLQSDGKILAGGSFTTSSETPQSYLARFTSEGLVDNAFLKAEIGGPVACLARQSDGKLLVGGEFGCIGGSTLGRLNADGTLDTSFAPSPSSSVMGIVVNQDQSIDVAGAFSFLAHQPRTGLARLLPKRD